jgi:hypothetical protein
MLLKERLIFEVELQMHQKDILDIVVALVLDGEWANFNYKKTPLLVGNFLLLLFATQHDI